MKSKILFILIIFPVLLFNSGCELTMREFTKITPENFYKTEKDAQLAVAALYSGSFTGGFFGASPYYGLLNISDISAGDMETCSYTSTFERLRNHEYSESTPQYTNNFFSYYFSSKGGY